jgi:tetratricopeptide (TPR) repeat protein
VEGAIECFQKAIKADPKNAAAHSNLGAALYRKGDLDGAITCYQKAIAADPKYALAHYALGVALHGKKDLEGAIACFRKAIALQPKDANAHTNLGSALYAKGDLEGAIACYQKAIALDPKDAHAHYNLGSALKDKGDLEGAIECMRKALALDPKYALAHYNLGHGLRAKGRLDEAIASFRKAIEIDPSFPEAHCNLGSALLSRGDFAAALGPIRRGHELGSKRGGWRYDSAALVRHCERLIEREKKLLSVLAGSSKPADARERTEWAMLCVQTRRYVAAARLAGEAFGADEKLANDRAAGHRYRAATAAALAGLGQGRDAGKLTKEERAALRRQALDWLKADLAAWRSHKDGSQRARALRSWRADRALAGVRDEEGLAKLPPAERAARAGLWAEVDKLLKPAP